jgi:hypothetical protein
MRRKIHKVARVNLYIPDAELQSFEKAKSELGESLSSVFVDCLKQRLQGLGSSNIVLTFWDEDKKPTIKKSFAGRWIIGDENSPGVWKESQSIEWKRDPKYEGRGTPHGGPIEKVAGYSVAVTSKGQFAVYLHGSTKGSREPALKVYSSLPKLRSYAEANYADSPPLNLVLAVERAMSSDKPIEMDI